MESKKDMETPEEKAKRLGVPLIPARKPLPVDSNPVTGVCGQCGREVRRMEMYSCRTPNCPLSPVATL